MTKLRLNDLNLGYYLIYIFNNINSELYHSKKYLNNRTKVRCKRLFICENDIFIPLTCIFLKMWYNVVIGRLIIMAKIFMREEYLKKIRGFYNSDIIKAVTGIRRCGKSFFLLSVMEDLKANGVEEISGERSISKYCP